MRKLTATEAARTLSDVLDAVEHRGESFVVTRRGAPIARIEPAARANGAEVRELLRRWQPDRDFWKDIQEVRALLTDEVHSWEG